MAWSLAGNIRGPQGIQGIQGPAGAAAVGISPTLANATTVTETVVASFALPAGFLTAGALLNLWFFGQVSSTATVTYRLRLGTAGLITDALLIAFAASAAGVANAHTSVDGIVSCLTAGAAGTATAGGQAMLASGLIGPATAAFAAAAVNTTVAQKLSLTAQLSAAANTLTARGGALQKLV
jgi:hypothetical protein